MDRSQDLTNQLMEKFHSSSSHTTPLDKADFIIASLDSLSLSEPVFGL
jgi:hypothetical protein